MVRQTWISTESSSYAARIRAEGCQSRLMAEHIEQLTFGKTVEVLPLALEKCMGDILCAVQVAQHVGHRRDGDGPGVVERPAGREDGAAHGLKQLGRVARAVGQVDKEFEIVREAARVQADRVAKNGLVR